MQTMHSQLSAQHHIARWNKRLSHVVACADRRWVVGWVAVLNQGVLCMSGLGSKQACNLAQLHCVDSQSTQHVDDGTPAWQDCVGVSEPTRRERSTACAPSR
jgi:hypothetical protein